MQIFIKVLITVALLGFLRWVYHIYNVLWLKTEILRAKLRQQGIKGPLPSFLLGNVLEIIKIQSTAIKPPKGTVSHDYVASVFPHFACWKKAYGPTFFFSIGSMPVLYVSEPNLAREILLCKSLDVGRPSYLKKSAAAVVGESIISSSGETWVHQRKIIAPEFLIDKVKGMVEKMVEPLMLIIKSWEKRIESGGGSADVRVDHDLRTFSAEVVSRAVFGSNYSMGKQICLKLRDLQDALASQSATLGIPGMSCIPTKGNREIWRLDKEIKSLILKVASERNESGATVENDLLQAMLQNVSDGQVPLQKAQNFIVDNCKGIYFAGHETTGTTVTWTMMLLALHPEWQNRVREEIVEVCGTKIPDADMLGKMKTITMVVQETLRLYPATPHLQRELFEDMKFGELELPKGVNPWISAIDLHRDPDIWGPDVLEFNPARFEQGISSACKAPQVYMPFGGGPRNCLGQILAMAQMKMLLSLILTRFSISVSENYHHCLAYRLALEPEHGVNLILKKL